MFVKLFASILDSSVWEEPPATVKVWVTLLVMADQDGFVRATEKAVARRAILGLEETRKAIETLRGPDLESLTQEYGGARIERMEGGWQVLNYAKYREMRTPSQVREARKKQRQRARKRASGNEVAESDVGLSPDVPGTVPSVPTIASASSSASLSKKPEPAQTREGVAGCFKADHHRAAWIEAVSKARSPRGLEYEVRLLAEGGERLGKGAQIAYGWEVVGEALHSIGVAGWDLTSNTLQGFCRRLVETSAQNGAGASGGHPGHESLHERAMRLVRASEKPGGAS